eukprot:7711868-Pyramimonas_sp.AAC.1
MKRHRRRAAGRPGHEVFAVGDHAAAPRRVERATGADVGERARARDVRGRAADLDILRCDVVERPPLQNCGALPNRRRPDPAQPIGRRVTAVSYTHLTLPTILLV